MIPKVKQPRIDGANVSLILGHFQKCLTESTDCDLFVTIHSVTSITRIYLPVRTFWILEYPP